ncbi:hypothetical protein [Levilactobacillus angrenensis]|uniref:Uncharacterized protein n=1 Tax=Levilactobacillus angrenensis TaxID=2486020 RepID=A0ABW1U5A6_9LACO|nr:hypothetical protein [Levilactobacillus angrenensis]
MNKRRHFIWSGLLALALLATLILPTPTAHASKRLTTIPQSLQGYWVTNGRTNKKIDRIYLHITAKSIETSAIARKSMKEALLLFQATHFDGQYLITRKQTTNHMKGIFGEDRTATFNQVAHHRWNLYGIFAHKLDKTGYLTNRYALAGHKLYVQELLYSEKPHGFTRTPLAAHERRHGKTPTLKYSKISPKYLHVIGLDR